MRQPERDASKSLTPDWVTMVEERGGGMVGGCVAGLLFACLVQYSHDAADGISKTFSFFFFFFFFFS